MDRGLRNDASNSTAPTEAFSGTDFSLCALVRVKFTEHRLMVRLRSPQAPVLPRSGVRGSLLMQRAIGIVVELAVDANHDFALGALPGMAVTEIPGALNAQVGRFSRTAFLRAAHGPHYTRKAWRWFEDSPCSRCP